MGSIVGFTIYLELSPEESERTIARQSRALSPFAHLERITLPIGSSTLHVWGHSPLSERIHKMPDESTLALIGSPHGEVTWHDVQENLLKIDHPEDFELPWDGRAILLHVSADGNRWTIWNDWLGSIPTYYTDIRTGRIASTLEPVTVAAAGCTPDDFFLPGLVSLLVNGHFISDWTLYKDVKTIPPDSVTQWDEKGFRAKQVWTLQPSQDRWAAGWDDLVDEMHALSHKAIADVLKTQSTWILPLSSGLDSRLIAAVAADVGVNAFTYAWGSSENTDVVYSRKIAKTLGFPWKHVTLPKDFLVRYTPQWSDWFGSAMHFQGMYLMSFLDELKTAPAAPVLSGYIGDVLAGDGLKNWILLHGVKSYQVNHEWYSDWGANQLRAVAKFPVDEALKINTVNLKEQIESFPGARFQQLLYLQLWNRQRSFTSYLSIVKDYWRGAATPFINRSYARFCTSLPRATLENRRLLGDVFRRYYGRLAVIPGTYADSPFVLTGKYLVQRRVDKMLPSSLRRQLLKGFGKVDIGVDFEPIQTHGKDSLWPLFEVWDQLAEWFDVRQLEQDYQTIMASTKDPRPLRRLQAVQTFASQFLNRTKD